MNRDTIASLHDIKQAILQQQTSALREIAARLNASEAKRDALVASMNEAACDDTVVAAMATGRYRAFQKQALKRLTGQIDSITREFRAAEEELSVVFAEVRALERLME